MKVLYFHQYFSTPSGATGTRSYDMAQNLIKRGHEVLMVCCNYQVADSGLGGNFSWGFRRGMVDGIDVLEFDLTYSNHDAFIKRMLLFISYAILSIKIVFSEKYDLVFSTSTPLTVGIPGVIARWLRKKPFVFEVRDLWPELPKEMGIIRNPFLLSIASVLEWTIYHSAHRTVGLSPGIVRGIEKRGVRKSKISYISNGSNLDLFDGINPKRPIGIESKDFFAIYTGTHGIANGLDAALDTALELKNRGRGDIKLCFIGTGQLKASLIHRAEQQGLDNCLFLNPIPKVELVEYLKGADIGMQLLKNVSAFYNGTSPNKFFEYIAAELPVINNYPGWLSEIIISKKCGYAIEPDQPKIFADTLEYAADHNEELKKMGKNGYNLAMEEFDRNKLATKFSIWLEGAVDEVFN